MSRICSIQIKMAFSGSKISLSLIFNFDWYVIMIVKHHCKAFKFVIVESICNPINIYGCNIA